MQAVILAAGRGTRLQPVSDYCSKAMTPAVGKPLVARVLDSITAHEVRDLVVVVSPDDDAIIPSLQAQLGPEFSLHFVVQQQRLGMAHALAQAAHLLRDRFLLSACDSLCPAHHVAELLAAATEVDGAFSLLDVGREAVSKSAAVVLEEGLVRRIVEKPRPEEAPSTTISLPLYVLPRRVLDVLPELESSPRGEYELQDGLQHLIDAGARFVGVHTTWRRQVSTVDDLLQLTAWLLEIGEGAIDSPTTGATLQPPLAIDTNVEIGPDCVLGPNLYLERGCRVGAHSVVRNAIVMSGAQVPAGSRVENKVIVPES